MPAIRVQLADDRGLVWRVEDVLQLRTHYRLIGSMIGGIAGFQSQVSVMGLPLQLSPEEVSLGLQAGWMELYETSFSIPTVASAPAAPAAAAVSEQPPACCQADAMQVDERAGEEELDEFYAAYYGLQPPPAAAQQKPEEQQQHRHHLAAMQQQQPVQEAAWQVAIASDGRFQAPLTVADAAGGSNSSSTTSGAKQQQQEQCGCVMRPVAWGYPRTPLQQLRLAVFGDLAARGFSLTGGSKFGGDFLAYPGDPHLYHAQYVVRVMLPQQALNPSVLQGLARGVHAARKHLLLATLHPAGANGAAADGAAQPGPGGSSEGGGDPLRSAAAALSAAATRAAAAALLRDGGGELRYITVVRDSGWGAE